MKPGVNWNILQSQPKQHCAPPVCETASKCLEPTKEKKKKKCLLMDCQELGEGAKGPWFCSQHCP